ncbi:CBS domain-containing protein [bacterium]|nr:CBS domain-containing protein [bacterium]
MADENLILKSKDRKLVTIEPRASISEAVNLMNSNSFRHLPVADGTKIVGIISERDIQRATKIEVDDLFSAKVVKESIDSNLIVADIMSWPVKTIEVSQPMVDAINLMIDQKVSSLLVVEDKHVVGIVTSHDFLGLLKDHLSNTELTTLEEFKTAWANSPIKSVVDALSQSGI